MPIKNYTSQVPVDRTIGYIEKRLVEHGATNILKEYRKDGMLDSLAFHAQLEDGKIIPFKLPANIEEAFNYLLDLRVYDPTPAQREKLWKQAQRTAWKLILDWIDIQMSMIELGQAKFAQVFLPYVYDFNRKLTMYELVEKDNFKMLGAPSGE